MIGVAFDPVQDVILVAAHTWGPHRDAELQLIFDTGATQTIRIADGIDGLGYSTRDGQLASASWRTSSPRPTASAISSR